MPLCPNLNFQIMFFHRPIQITFIAISPFLAISHPWPQQQNDLESLSPSSSYNSLLTADDVDPPNGLVSSSSLEKIDFTASTNPEANSDPQPDSQEANPSESIPNPGTMDESSTLNPNEASFMIADASHNNLCSRDETPQGSACSYRMESGRGTPVEGKETEPKSDEPTHSIVRFGLLNNEKRNCRNRPCPNHVCCDGPSDRSTVSTVSGIGVFFQSVDYCYDRRFLDIKDLHPLTMNP